MLRRHALPYHADSSHYFQGLAAEPWSIWLDSGGQGDIDILCAQPSTTLVTRGEWTEVRDAKGTCQSGDCPFALLRQTLGEPLPAIDDIPFAGGALGYFGYDLARRIEHLPDHGKTIDDFPDMAFGLYDWCLLSDHRQGITQLLARSERMDENRWRTLVARFEQGSTTDPKGRGLRLLNTLSADPDWPSYERQFRQVQHHLQEGDCYQVNLARCYEGKVTGDPWVSYQALRQTSPAPFGLYLNLPDGQLLSNSPERFLRLRGDWVETSPIKGTRPRHADPDRDAAEAVALQQSAKDRAENLMIVDLLRNDLGRSCRFGSIQVEQLFRLASFARVHHLVSDIRGRLRVDEDALSLMQNAFPGGSITGAPKLKAMEIIESLEPRRRGPYCGSAAYIGFDAQMDSNILIRTLTHRQGQVRFWSGGGIVADSEVEAEFRETEHKAAAFLSLLADG